MGTRFLIVLFSLFFTCNIYAIGPIKASVTPTIAPSGVTNFALDASAESIYMGRDNLEDETANNNDLTNNGTITFSTTRPSGFTTGKSISLNGTDQYASILHGDLEAGHPLKPTNVTEDITTVMWIYRDTSTNVDTLFDLANKWKCTVDATGDIILRIVDSSPNTVSNDIGGAVDQTDGQWEHYIIELDGSTSTVTLTLSTETAFANTGNHIETVFTSIDDVAYDSEPHAYGSDKDNADHFDGLIYQWGTFSRKLTVAEKEAIYTYGLTGEDDGS